MAELNYLKELTLNFNLRKPTSKRPTNVYAVVKVCGKQIKIPTTAKINAYLWDSKKQVPMLLNSMSNAERDNAKLVFSIINSFQSAFSDYYCYFYQNFQEITSEDVRGFFEKNVLSKLIVNKNMAKNGVPNVTRQKKATNALDKALDIYAKNISDSTLTTYKYNLQNFKDYCADIKRDSVLMLTKKGMIEFEAYLKGKGKTSNNIRNCLRVVKTLVNEILAKHPDFKRYGIEEIEVKLPKDKKSEGKKVELTDDEIAAIKNCEGLTPVKMEYRDLFILECLTGQRVSDIPTLFNPDLYTIEGEYFSFITKKEKVAALVKRTPEVLEIIDKYKDGFKHININSRYLAQGETIALKEIAKKAGLNRVISYKDNKGSTLSKPLHELISSHFGRHTFVTQMARIMSLEKVKLLTGHKDTQSLNKNYLHQTVGDRINILNKAFNKAEKNDIPTTEIGGKDVLNELFAYDMLLNVEHAMKNDINFNNDSTRQAIETIKNVVGLSSYSKDIDKEKVEALDRVVFELSYYYRDAQLYSAYQYKEHYFGIVDKVASYDEINSMFANEDIERPKQVIDALIEEYENR
ncbi:MAG: phage integrase SAM-like domain-containing protein [Prevotella sp.]|nr:phage integrase SAM-like domain-containing protein [Prevotella sp.]MBR1557627.1 phage integrase SAM-like domain-containing protein [Prevotella sp.]